MGWTKQLVTKKVIVNLLNLIGRGTDDKSRVASLLKTDKQEKPQLHFTWFITLFTVFNIGIILHTKI